MAIIDWDFGGSHVLPFADRDFQVITDLEQEGVEDKEFEWQNVIDELIRELLLDCPLFKSFMSMKLPILDEEAAAANKHVYPVPQAWL
ncbi:hypothetical protein ID866_13184 [Astraeus odoratus]|nr:hypothetical protein ID866_13184 [Astraeus odoratus]